MYMEVWWMEELIPVNPRIERLLIPRKHRNYKRCSICHSILAYKHDGRSNRIKQLHEITFGHKKVVYLCDRCLAVLGKKLGIYLDDDNLINSIKKIEYSLRGFKKEISKT